LAVDGYIGLGSNLGDPVAELRRGVLGLVARGVEVPVRSSLYRTEPVDTSHPEWFVNAVAAFRFDGSPMELLERCRDVEAARGRVREERNGPRTIDVDILLVGESVVSLPGLIVPHPRFHLRRFVLEPLVEIAPDAIHPVLNKTMRELLGECTDVNAVERLEVVFT
jgi:2-amino-4-hydroxy-6-hydroxymethyldihydropteridine diphosphokinase